MLRLINEVFLLKDNLRIFAGRNKLGNNGFSFSSFSNPSWLISLLTTSDYLAECLVVGSWQLISSSIVFIISIMPFVLSFLLFLLFDLKIWGTNLRYEKLIDRGQLSYLMSISNKIINQVSFQLKTFFRNDFGLTSSCWL